MTKIVKIILFTAAVLGFEGALSAQPKGYVISPMNAETVVSENFVRESVEYLCSETLGGRACGTPGNRDAAIWLERQFRQEGLQCIGGAYMHGFSASGFFGRNVIGLIPGSGPGYVIVMSHFDNLGTLNGAFYPGADSNASGTAALLQLVRMFVKMSKSGKQYSSSIVFVALDGKEEDLAGSRELWNRISAGKLGFKPSDIKLVVNLDQLGSTLSPVHKDRPDYMLMLSSPGARRSELENAMKLQRIDMDIAYDYYGSPDFTNLFFRKVSDQRVFLENGIPVVMFTSGITMLNNKTGDTPDTLDYPVLVKRIRLIFHYLHRIL